MNAEVISLGCRLNIAESETIRALLAGAGEVVVINSCAVTGEAVRQTRKARPEARLLVTGCAAEIERDQLTAMAEVDGLVPNAAKLDARSYNVRPPNTVRPELVEGPFLSSAALGTEKRPFDKLRANGNGLGHTRAFVAVQNGCDHACTFCVIPQGRGPSRSLSVIEVLREIERHFDAPEVVLTGVDGQQHRIELPAHGSGAQAFTIDPVALGLAPGNYSISAQASDGTKPAVEISGRLDSVRMSAGGILLQVAGIGDVDPAMITGFKGKPSAQVAANSGN